MQLVKKFPTFHGTRRFITALTSVRHLSLSWASPIQSIYPHPTSWRSILILSTHLRLDLPSGILPSGFPHQDLLYIPLSWPIRATCPAHLILLHFITAQYWVSSTNHLAPRYAFSSIPPLPRPSEVQIFSSTPCSQTLSASFPPAMSANKFHTSSTLVAGSIQTGVSRIFIDITSFWSHYGPGVDSASNRNEYQEYFLGVKAAGAWGWQPYHLHVPIVFKSTSLNLLKSSGPVQACNEIILPLPLPLTLIYCKIILLSYSLNVSTLSSHHQAS